MGENKFIESQINEPQPEVETTKPSTPKKENPLGKALHGVLDGSVLTKESFVKILPFIFYLTFLAILFIANTYYAERTVMRIEQTKKELKEFRSEHIATKAELMIKSKQSEVSIRLAPLGIKPTLVPPEKIIVTVDTTAKK
jgi:hypothetical protein